MVDEDFEKSVLGYGLTTANVLYHFPDHPDLLQRFIWQFYDQAPEFPHLKEFLDFWSRELDGPLHSVRIAHQSLIRPAEWRSIGGEFVIH